MVMSRGGKEYGSGSSFSAHIALYKFEFNIYIVQSAQFFPAEVSPD
jgi:hypothetical protein